MLHSDDELDDEELALLQAEVQALQAVLAPSYEAVHTPDGDSDSAPLEPAQPPSSQATAAKGKGKAAACTPPAGKRQTRQKAPAASPKQQPLTRKRSTRAAASGTAAAEGDSSAAGPDQQRAAPATDEYDAGENVDDGDFEEISTDAWAADGPGEEAASSEPAIKAVHLKALRQAIASALGTDTASGLRALDAGVPETREHLQATREAYLAQQRQQPPLQDGQQRQQNIKDALAANRAIQARLQETLQALDGHLARVEDTQRQVYRFLDTERRGSYTGMHSLQNVPGIEGKVGSTDPGVSRFWLAARSAPAVNEDTQRLRQVYQVLPHRFTIRPWGEKEVKKLQDAVLSAVQEKKFSQVMGDLQQRTAAGQQHSLADVRRLNEEIASLTLQSPGVEATAGALTPQDWERLAQVAFDSERSAADCRTHWLNGCRPSLRLTEDWEAAEDGKLAALVEEHQRCNWLKIAEELGTGRTAAACLARYQCVLSRGGGHNRALVQGSWTAEEDARLRAAVLKHGERDWRAVAFEVGGRSVAQVLHRWRDCIGQQSLRKGRWLAEEDKQLVKAVEACGRKWSEVAKLVPNRTDVQCRDRYVNVLDPALVRSRWSAEEDETLLGAVEELRRPDGSVKWSAVAQRLPGRTDNNCTWRYQRLVKHCPGAPGRKRPVRGRQHATARGRGRGRKREWQSSSESEESAAESSDFDESANEYSDDSANESDDEASPPPKRCRAAQVQPPSAASKGKRRKLATTSSSSGDVEERGGSESEEGQLELANTADVDAGEASQAEQLAAGQHRRRKAKPKPAKRRKMEHSAAVPADQGGLEQSIEEGEAAEQRLSSDAETSGSDSSASDSRFRKVRPPPAPIYSVATQRPRRQRKVPERLGMAPPDRYKLLGKIDRAAEEEEQEGEEEQDADQQQQRPAQHEARASTAQPSHRPDRDFSTRQCAAPARASTAQPGGGSGDAAAPQRGHQGLQHVSGAVAATGQPAAAGGSMQSPLVHVGAGDAAPTAVTSGHPPSSTPGALAACTSFGPASRPPTQQRQAGAAGPCECGPVPPPKPSTLMGLAMQLAAAPRPTPPAAAVHAHPKQPKQRKPPAAQSRGRRCTSGSKGSPAPNAGSTAAAETEATPSAAAPHSSNTLGADAAPDPRALAPRRWTSRVRKAAVIHNVK